MEFGFQLVEGKAEGRTAGGVEAVKFFGLRVSDDGNEVAAAAVAGGLHEAEGGIDGGAAGCEAVDADL